MKKVLTSFAHGKSFDEMLQVALPTFHKYGTKYDYDVFVPCYSMVQKICESLGWDHNRPISWLKVPIMKHLLTKYESVLWVDSDVIITNKAPDISQYIDPQALQGLSIHMDLYEGFVPNCGVWFVTNKYSEFLDNIWNKKEYINHRWWEQMAVISLMNWIPKSNKQQLSDYGLSTIELPYEFNVHKNDIRFNESSIKSGYFLHATMWPNRLQTMKEWVRDEL